MRKILLLISALLLFGINNSFSAWYGKHSVPMTHYDGTTWCDTDGDTTGGSPSFSKSPQSGSYTYDSKVSGSKDGNNMWCKYWDGRNPESLSVSYNAGWTNSTQTITVKVKDRGGSRLKKIILQQSQNGGSWSTVRTWNNLTNGNNTLVVATWDRTPVNNSSFKYKIIIYDYAGNSNSKINNNLIRFDTTPPSESDIGNIIPAHNSYFVANNSKNVRLSVGSNGGSPITKIEYYYEKYNTSDSYSSKQTENDGFINRNLNFQNVDNSLISGKNYREYSFKVTKVCDEVGYCTSFNKIFTHRVYANNIDMGKSSISSTTALSNGNKIADGSVNSVQLALKDKYNNKILKVKKVNNAILRNVDINVNYNDTLYLDQYKQNGSSAVYIGNNLLDIGTNNNTPNSGIFRNQANGIYNLDFKVYSPTTNAYDKAKGNFKINSIKAKVTSYSESLNFVAGGVDFKFKPIYKLNFKNEGAKKYGFIEGITQSGGLNILGNNGSTTNKNIYLEFGKYDDATGENIENTDFNLKLKSVLVEEGHKTDISLLDNYSFSPFSFNTLLMQQNTSVLSYDLTYLASFIKYNIDSKNIVYPTDIIGKMTYSSGTGTNSVSLKGIKVLGKTYSEKSQNIFGNQDADINKIAGKINKGELRQSIRKNAYDMVRNLDIVNDCSIIGITCKYKILGNVTYYKIENGGKIKFSENIVKNNFDNGKTILIEGGDLIVNENINLSSGIAGIVVLKNIDGDGGNILIDDDVLEIDATIYVDKALFPYDINNFDRILTLDDGQGYFKNQLHIKGSVFSNNTIGGARGASGINYKCAYYDAENCDITKAQKFDLNFMRRYFVYDDDNDPTTVKNPANGGNNAVPSYNKNYEYPLIIEYNSLIQITPPPLFNK